MGIEEVTKEQLANMLEYSLVRPFVTNEDFKILCEESIKFGFKMVEVNSSQISICKRYLANSEVRVGAVISFPLGQTTIESKVFETKNAIENGADEIDYVINIVELKNKNYAYIEREMSEIVGICRNMNVTSKVIFENWYLTKEEITILCKIAFKVKPDFIKTSTGFNIGGALVEDVKLMKYLVGDDIKVKAEGGIKSWETCKAMLEAGAERIGTCSSIKILEEFEAQENSKILI